MNCCRYLFKFIPAGLVLAVASSFTSAFEIDGSKWFGAATEIYVDMEGISGTGILWNAAFISAMNEWMSETDFTFNLIEEHRDPCQNDGLNGVNFVADFCGAEFGNNTLAVTILHHQSTLLGEPDIIEADIIINQAEDFDVFDGNLVQFGPTFEKIEFRRTILHELGHVIGLDHEADASAIMAPNIGDLDRLQADDIAGVNALYSGLDNCQIQQLRFGTISAALDNADCTVAELTVGGTDNSFIDLYRFELSATTELEFTMSSPTLESVLLLATDQLDFLDVDTTIDADCNSTLSATLQAGSYLLLANTYDEQIRPDCQLSGAYQLNAVYLSDSPGLLGSSGSLLGGMSAAQFQGGITADNGLSYGNKFKPEDSLDISTSITVDPNHVGEAGFLVAAAIIDGVVLLLNEQGNFVDSWVAPDPIIRAVSKTLQATETFAILTDLVPASFGIDTIVVDFVVGYGLDNAPGEVYFHQSPLNLIVAP